MTAALFLAVAIVAHEPGYTTSLAGHLQRWFQRERIVSRVVTPAQMSAALAQEKLALLVGFNEPTAAEMQTIRAFRARGGKLVVFHSASPQLGALMGVKPLGYTKARYPGCWSRMDFCAKTPDGLPTSILQTSTVLQCAAPVKGVGRVIATWSDRQGRPTGDAAWIASPAGYWMTHVLLADGDENMKARLLGAIAGSVSPNLWSYQAHLLRESEEANRVKLYAMRQKPRKGEIHAVWEHSGCGLYPGDWPKTIRVLQDARVTDLFVNVAGAGFAHYGSNVLPRSRTFEQEGDQLAACLAAAKGTGIRVHAWILCFNGTRGSPDRQEVFRKRGWRLKNREGKLTEYLDPSNADVHAYLLSAIEEIGSRYPVSGIHLDYVRWYERSAKPANAAACISQFVTAARQRVKRPKWLTAAVLGLYPSCVKSVGQDWGAWIDRGLIDYAVPMDYADSNAKFESYVAAHAAVRARAARTIVGIGVTANESRLDARKVIDQVNLVRKYNLAGESMFDLDTTLERQILPYLKLGLW